MKKLIVFLLIASLVLTMAACKKKNTGKTTTDDTTSSEESTTAEVTTTEELTTTDGTTTDGTTTNASSSTTEEPTDSDEPSQSSSESENGETRENEPTELDGEDISDSLVTWGDHELKAGFEYHGTLDGNLALVVCLVNDPIYERVFGEGGSTALLEGYVWKAGINGKLYNITVFSSHGKNYIRMDVQSAGFVPHPDETQYDISVYVYDTEGEMLYYATNIASVIFKPTTVKEDPSRTGTKVTGLTPISGPNAGNAEGYEKLFDGNIFSKVCTNDFSPIVFKTETAVKIDSYSLITANDNIKWGGRVPESWKLLGSTTGEDGSWVEIDARESSEMDPLADFTEYNFKIATEKQAEYQFYKVEITSTVLYQFSELQLFTAN